jgi:hypothetical protein
MLVLPNLCLINYYIYGVFTPVWESVSKFRCFCRADDNRFKKLGDNRFVFIDQQTIGSILLSVSFRSIQTAAWDATIFFTITHILRVKCLFRNVVKNIVNFPISFQK